MILSQAYCSRAYATVLYTAHVWTCSSSVTATTAGANKNVNATEQARLITIRSDTSNRLVSKRDFGQKTDDTDRRAVCVTIRNLPSLGIPMKYKKGTHLWWLRCFDYLPFMFASTQYLMTMYYKPRRRVRWPTAQTPNLSAFSWKRYNIPQWLTCMLQGVLHRRPIRWPCVLDSSPCAVSCPISSLLPEVGFNGWQNKLQLICGSVVNSLSSIWTVDCEVIKKQNEHFAAPCLSQRIA